MQERKLDAPNDLHLRILFFIMQAGNFAGYVSQAYGMDNIFSPVSQAYILICVALFAFCVLKYPLEMNRSRLVLLLLAMAVVVAVSSMARNRVGAVQFVILLLGYLALPIYLIYTPYLPTRKSMVNQIKIFNLLIALFFVYSFFVRPEYNADDALSFGYSNPNRLGIYLVQNMSILLALAKDKKEKYTRILFIAICAFETYLVYLTGARIALVCVIILWVYFLNSNRAKIGRTTIIIFMVLPIVFLILVMVIYYFEIIPQDAMLFDKKVFSGRERLYLYVLQSMDLPTWIIGNVGQYQFGNAHNAFLSIISTTGVLGLLIFYLFFFFAFMDLRECSENNRYKVMPLVGLLLLFVEGCAESATLVSGAMYAYGGAQLIYLIYYGHRMIEDEQ